MSCDVLIGLLGYGCRRKFGTSTRGVSTTPEDGSVVPGVSRQLTRLREFTRCQCSWWRVENAWSSLYAGPRSMKMANLRILVADDNPMVRIGLRILVIE
jgi:hypothetical protein